MTVGIGMIEMRYIWSNWKLSFFGTIVKDGWLDIEAGQIVCIQCCNFWSALAFALYYSTLSLSTAHILYWCIWGDAVLLLAPSLKTILEKHALMSRRFTLHAFYEVCCKLAHGVVQTHSEEENSNFTALASISRGLSQSMGSGRAHWETPIDPWSMWEVRADSFKPSSHTHYSLESWLVTGEGINPPRKCFSHEERSRAIP